MTLTVRRFHDAEEFAEAAMLFLLEHEVEHCLLIGLVGQTIREPGRWTGAPLFVSVDRSGTPVAAALRTPPYPVTLSRLHDEAAIPLLVEQFAGEAGVPGVNGPAEASRAFAEEWARQTGQTGELAMRERLYQARQVRHPAGVAGTMRRATEADRALLIAWNRAFNEEAFGEPPEEERIARWVDARLRDEQAGIFFWEDGEPVAFAGYSGPTPDGIRIAPVYTPPSLRGRGYGSALTAALTQRLLDEGRRFCALYTDLANPVSNSIYQRIGYEPVADAAAYRFR